MTSHHFEYDLSRGVIGDYKQKWMIVASMGNVTGPEVEHRRPTEAEKGEILDGCRTDVDIVCRHIQRCRSEILGPLLVDKPGKERDKNVYLEEIATFLKDCEEPGGTCTLYYVLDYW